MLELKLGDPVLALSTTLDHDPRHLPGHAEVHLDPARGGCNKGAPTGGNLIGCDDDVLYNRCAGDVGSTGSGGHPAGVSVQPSSGGSVAARGGGGGQLVVGDVPILNAQAM